MIAGIRSEAFSDAALAQDGAPGLEFTARIDVVEGMGSEVYAYFDVPCESELPADLLESVERGDEAAVGQRGNVRQVVARLPVASRVACRSGGDVLSSIRRS